MQQPPLLLLLLLQLPLVAVLLFVIRIAAACRSHTWSSAAPLHRHITSGILRCVCTGALRQVFRRRSAQRIHKVAASPVLVLTWEMLR
jgi:hypothetical protein